MGQAAKACKVSPHTNSLSHFLWSVNRIWSTRMLDSMAQCRWQPKKKKNERMVAYTFTQSEKFTRSLRLCNAHSSHFVRVTLIHCCPIYQWSKPSIHRSIDLWPDTHVHDRYGTIDFTPHALCLIGTCVCVCVCLSLICMFSHSLPFVSNVDFWFMWGTTNRCEHTLD